MEVVSGLSSVARRLGKLVTAKVGGLFRFARRRQNFAIAV